MTKSKLKFANISVNQAKKLCILGVILNISHQCYLQYHLLLQVQSHHLLELTTSEWSPVKASLNALYNLLSMESNLYL